VSVSVNGQAKPARRPGDAGRRPTWSFEESFPTRPFIWAALAAAVAPGFAIGAALFVVLLAGGAGAWWTAAAQAHGHLQLFGFAGLMVLGVGLHFLPRLRGAPLAWPQLVPWALALYGGGLLLRLAAQLAGPAAGSAGGPAIALRALLAVSGLLSLAGATVAIAMLARTGWSGPPLRTRPGVRQVFPLMVVSWAALWLALAVNAGGALAAALAGTWRVPPPADQVVLRLALYGWLVPVAVAFAARNYPLFLRTRPASGVVLRADLALLLGGLAGDVAARAGWVSSPALAAAGLAGEGLALLWFTAAIGALGSKVTRPGRISDPQEASLADLSWVPLGGAFVWLAVTGVVLLVQAGAVLGAWQPLPEDAERHALGAGFLLVLIVGMALRLLPGFAGGPRRRVDLAAAGAAVALAHAAAVLRVAPVLAIWLAAQAGFTLPAWTGRLLTGTLAVAGVVGIFAVAALWLALRVPLGAPRPRGAPAQTLLR
jgi:uncharacterized protein involved in response to NO